MAEYEVRITEELVHAVIVEAQSEQEATERGYNIIMNGNDSDYFTESLGTTHRETFEVN